MEEPYRGSPVLLALRGEEPMSINRHNARRDANEPDIVATLLANGFEVLRLNQPTDLLVWRKSGVGFVLIEVKTKSGRLTVQQVDFFNATVGLPRGEARTPEEALALAQQWA
jgi:hypothetical protein